MFQPRPPSRSVGRGNELTAPRRFAPARFPHTFHVAPKIKIKFQVRINAEIVVKIQVKIQVKIEVKIEVKMEVIFTSICTSIFTSIGSRNRAYAITSFVPRDLGLGSGNTMRAIHHVVR